MNGYEYVMSSPWGYRDSTGRASSPWGKPQGWKKVSGSGFDYKAVDIRGSSLEELAYAMTKNVYDRACLRPVDIQNMDAARKRYPNKIAECGDIFSVANRVSTVAMDHGVKAVLVARGLGKGESDRSRAIGFIGLHPERWGHAVTGSPRALATYIAVMAQEGKAPLSTLDVIAHAARGSGLTPDGKSYFGPITLNKIASNPNSGVFGYGMPNFDKLIAGKYPPRCWFTPGARVVLAGCKSSDAAKAWSWKLLANGPLNRGYAMGTKGTLKVYSGNNGRYVGSVVGKTGKMTWGRLKMAENAWDIHHAPRYAQDRW
jgi:hypothetical protein